MSETALHISTKQCSKCEVYRNLEDFPLRGEGTRRHARCKFCRRKYHYEPRKGTKRAGERRTEARDGDHRQAQRRIQTLVDNGTLPRPSTLPCVDCGHKTEDEGGKFRRHEYDHYLGYAPEHHETVEVRCKRCHKTVTLARAQQHEKHEEAF